MPSRELEEVITMLRSRPAVTSDNVDDRRKASDARGDMYKPDDDITIKRVGVNGVPAEWISAPNSAKDRVLLHLRGGGYVVGSMRSHRALISWLARAAGARALGLEYRLAPENPFPAAVEDSVAAYRWLISNGDDPAKIAIAGDSAGGGLTIATLIALRYLGLPMPGAGVCLSAWTDLTQSGDSMRSNAEADPTVGREGLDGMAAAYAGDRDPAAPLLSPLFSDLHGLPPLLLMVGSIEVLLDDSTRLAERARAAGVDVTLEVWDDMPHVWHNHVPLLPEARQAVERVGEFLRQHLNGAGA